MNIEDIDFTRPSIMSPREISDDELDYLGWNRYTGSFATIAKYRKLLLKYHERFGAHMPVEIRKSLLRKLK